MWSQDDETVHTFLAIKRVDFDVGSADANERTNNDPPEDRRF